MKKFRTWAPEDTEIARQMLADNELPEAFLTRLGRSETAAREHIKRKDVRAKTESRAAAPKIPAGVIEDAVRRSLLPERTFGDPPPGYSALDRRNRAEASL
jgi:hypothetical protein